MIVGVDPGNTGAVALLDDDGTLIDVWDIPVIDRKISAALLAGAEHWDPSVHVIVLEDVSAFGGNGSIGNFSLGRSKGVIEGVFHAHRIILVSPSTWKRDMKLSQSGLTKIERKDKARAAAVARWPEHAGKFVRKKDADRAEAALIAEWYRTRGNK